MSAARGLMIHLLQWRTFSALRIFFQGMITLFSVITLPVEYDASYRAVVWLENAEVVEAHELEGVNDALKWAASTYVVAALAAATYLLYYVSMLRD